MLHASVRTTGARLVALRELDGLRARLGEAGRQPVPWVGSLRRSLRARSIDASTSIEGFSVGEARALALSEGAAHEPGDRDAAAVADYARAMLHVAALAEEDVAFRWTDRVLLDLHFDLAASDADARPGRWRRGPMLVTRPRGAAPYVAPDAAAVPGLMRQVARQLAREDDHVVVRAALAHLHVVSVHPCRDGNGRLGRIVQSLVLARDGLLAPELGSIEEQLGERTADYDEVLAAVQGPSYEPGRDTAPWVDLCIDLHLAQARRRLQQLDEAGERWRRLEGLVAGRGWPDRLVVALEQASFGGTDRRSYARETEVSPATASADLRRLADAALLRPEGRGSAQRYLPGPDLH